MEIKHQNNDKNGRFFIEENDQIAEMTYVWAGSDKFIIDHTAVPDAFKGRGAGKLLVAAAVSYARDNGKKIIPLCPFAKSVIQKTEAYHDVL